MAAAPDESLVIHVDGLTDIGLYRGNNEDAWWAGRPGGESRTMHPGPEALRFKLAEGPVALLVSDGVGGANAGEVASHMAVSLVTEGIARELPALNDVARARRALLRALRDAHEAILAKSDEDGHDGMGATLSVLCFTPGREACWAQAGDSRIYVLRGGELRQISRDHSPVGRMRQAGRITEAQAREHPARNQIDLSMGDRLNPFEPDVDNESVSDGDVFLVCSDGLSDGLWDDELQQILSLVKKPSDLRRIVQMLVEEAKLASGRDNITAVVGFVTAERKPVPAWKKALGLATGD